MQKNTFIKQMTTSGEEGKTNILFKAKNAHLGCTKPRFKSLLYFFQQLASGSCQMNALSP